MPKKKSSGGTDRERELLGTIDTLTRALKRAQSRVSLTKYNQVSKASSSECSRCVWQLLGQRKELKDRLEQLTSREGTISNAKQWKELETMRDENAALKEELQKQKESALLQQETLRKQISDQVDHRRSMT